MLHILVVDDEAIVLSLVRDALEDEGYHVQTFTRGQDALDSLTFEPADLLLTDIRMPGITGIELVKAARNIRPDLAVIFMTGYANLSSAKDAIKHGASDYIMKPFELSEIRQAVRQALASKAKNATRSSDQELTKLTDLSDMLFASSDIEAVLASTLKFAVMHHQAQHGSIITCHPKHSALLSLTASKGKILESALNSEAVNTAVLELEKHHSQETMILTALSDHPFWSNYRRLTSGSEAEPAWSEAVTSKQILVLPVAVGERYYGWLMLAVPDDSSKGKQSDTKFLSFLVRQLGVTLENLFLLEDTQEAYTKLKEMQDQTIDLEKMATRGAMSAEIGHEMNNFLGVIAGNLSLLALHIKKKNYDTLQKHAIAINKTIDKMTVFTSHLMDLTSISSKKEMLYFDRALSEVIEYLKPQRRFRDVQLNISIISKDIPIDADATQLQQLLYNLFNNAADALAGRSPKIIDVELQCEPKQNRFSFIMKDNGSGFDADNITKAFNEKFTTKPHGHGFGLVVCKRIIENHGGKIQIDSAIDIGTTIRLDFPVKNQTEIPQLISH